MKAVLSVHGGGEQNGRDMSVGVSPDMPRSSRWEVFTSEMRLER